MAEITVALGGDGEIVFAVNWSEPMRAEFTSRGEAERFRAWLASIGCTVELDGSCAPCSAHHASGHDCPSCGASLGLRVKPLLRRLTRARIPTRPSRFLVVREQHRIRVELAEEARAAWLAEIAAADRAVEAMVAT